MTANVAHSVHVGAPRSTAPVDVIDGHTAIDHKTWLSESRFAGFPVLAILALADAEAKYAKVAIA